MIFAFSNDGIDWYLDFGPESFILSVEDLVRETTKISHEIRLPFWSLLLSPRQNLLNSHLARVPKGPNQQ